jgi:perosamine synthetase
MSHALSNDLSSKLALLGGAKTISQPMPLYSSFGPEEKAAAMEVLESGVLSKFIGAWTPDFYGGEKVQQFERAWEKFFDVHHAVSVNSATSGLICALGALDLEPGDEVIVSPWTMSADGAAILVWNAIPVFADIEERTFGLCPESIRKNITSRTKAILVSDIHGHAARLDEIMSIARAHNLKVIEDAAQAPGAKYKGRYVGTIADIGVFSLNYHKHIHTGEGGVCVTNDPVLAERMQLIRNHAESVVAKKGVSNLSNMIGFNFRLGEIEAAMGLKQLEKLPALAASRARACYRLMEGLRDLPGMRLPIVERDCTHVFYLFPLILDQKMLGVSRSRLAQALRAEGVPVVMEGYVNVHLLPMFQKKMAYGSSGFPWRIGHEESAVSYKPGICPVAERFQSEAVMGLTPCSHRYDDVDVDLVVAAFKKVWDNLGVLKEV